MLRRCVLFIAVWSCISISVIGCGERHSSTQSAGNSATQIGSVTGPVNIFTGQGSPQENIDIKGAWNPEAAHKIAEELLAKAAEVDSKLFCDIDCDKALEIEHSIIGDYHLIYGSKEVALLIRFSTPLGNGCHVCGGYISIFEFEKKIGGWSLVQSDLAAVHSGQYGSMESSKVYARTIGSNQYGIFIEDSELHQGYYDTGVEVWAKLADHYVNVLNIQTAADHEAAPVDTNWKSIIYIVQSANPGMFDIRLDINGKVHSSLIRESVVFFFDGVEYVSNRYPPYLQRYGCIKKNDDGECGASNKS